MHFAHHQRIPSIREQGIWNAIAGLLCALEAVVMGTVATHFLNLNSAGELTIAFALGNLFRTIGLWGTRYYHLSDLRKEFSFNDYKRARYFNLALMICTVLIYVLFLIFVRRTSLHKITVICIIEIVYLIECYEDLIGGEYQRRGRLDIGAKLLIVRWGSLLISYSLLVFFFRSLILALVCSLLISSILFFLVLKFYWGIPKDSRDYYTKTKALLSKEQKRLLRVTFPLFLISFLTFFLNNVAKYSLDYYYSEEIQACYGFISLAVFAVEMVSAFIYMPTMTRLTQHWIEARKKEVLLEVLRQIIIIIGLTLLCGLAGWFFGIPILSKIFAVDLSQYQIDLIFNIFSGGFMSFVMYASALLSVIRKQNLQLVIYGITDFIGGILIWELAKYYGIRGGSIGGLVVFFVQTIAMYIVLYIIFYNRFRYK